MAGTSAAGPTRYTCVGSIPSVAIAPFTADWKSCMPLSVARLARVGNASCQPSPWATDCHCLGSPFGTTSSGDLAKAAQQSALMMQARTDSFGKLLNFFRLLEGGQRKYVAIVLFQ